MKSNDTERELTASEAVASGTFGLSADNEIHLMRILRDNLYSDKILAVLREYAANAWDANRVNGKADVPIEVHLATFDDPNLRIRDYGSGLSPIDIFKVYTQYGASTKRDDNETVGHLGIGSKSAFAYADTFTVTSWYEGKKRIYVAVLDASDRGTMNLFYEEDSDEPSGVEVSVAVKKNDFATFRDRAAKLFQFFNPRPVINHTLPPLPEEVVRLTNGEISLPGEDHHGDTEDGGKWVAIMGCVPYRINLEQIDAERLNRALFKMNGSVNFGIGNVQISASREELKYSDATKSALADKLDALVDEYVERALNLMDSDAVSAWEKRMKIRVLRDLDLEIPEEFANWGNARVQILDTTSGNILPFSLVHNKAAVGSVTVTPKLRFILHDVKGAKSLKGWQIHADDYVVKGAHGKTLEETKKKLEEILVATNLTGVPIVNLSTLPTVWTGGRRAGTKNIKHKQAAFELNVKLDRSYVARPYSSAWTGVERVPEDTDVFVVLEAFEPTDGSFYSDYCSDRNLAKAFGITMPTVYGYKSTEKKPRTVESCTGTEYKTWRKSLLTEIMTPERQKLVDAYNVTNNSSITGYNGKLDGRRTNAIARIIGEDHPLTVLARKFDEHFALLKGWDLHNVIRVLAVQDVRPKLSYNEEVKAIAADYPLFRGSFRELWNDYNEDGWRDWARYILLVDNDKKSTDTVIQGKNEHANDQVHAN